MGRRWACRQLGTGVRELHADSWAGWQTGGLHTGICLVDRPVGEQGRDSDNAEVGIIGFFSLSLKNPQLLVSLLLTMGMKEFGFFSPRYILFSF